MARTYRKKVYRAFWLKKPKFHQQISHYLDDNEYSNKFRDIKKSKKLVKSYFSDKPVTSWKYMKLKKNLVDN